MILKIVAIGLLAAALILAVLALVSPGPEPPAQPPLVPPTEATEPPPRATSGEPDKPSMLPLKATTPEEVRQVVHFCRAATPTNAATLRRMALKSEDPLVAGNAIQALGRMKEAGNGVDFTALLRDPRPRIRQEAVVALGERGDAKAVPVLAGVLRGTDQDLRLLAIQALGKISGEDAKKLMEAFLTDPRSSEADKVFARTVLRGGF